MVINSQLAPCQQSYRITLDLTVDQDFNPRQIDFNKVFNLSEWESINTHIEEFQIPRTLHFTGPASSVFLLSTIGGQYITLYGLQFGTYIKKSLYVAPKVFPQCKERIGGKVTSPNRDNFKGKVNGPNRDSSLNYDTVNHCYQS